ncbi:MAG: adenylyltransferase/cytidyltransferase family protein [Neptunomonas phycophila]|uniref:adenylyltransferase/cytidyltransferase family protein n=1 Tax=Neptunomonas phycophila TaxID=1572645 RepID=UPI003B8D0DFC
MGINYKNPTALMLGRFQPFHDGHLELFKQMLAKEGQVCIMVRDTQGTSEKDPFDFNFVKYQIDLALTEYVGKYEVILVPNITGVYYGRDVGYNVEKIDLSPELESISATEIRKGMSIES